MISKTTGLGTDHSESRLATEPEQDPGGPWHKLGKKGRRKEKVGREELINSPFSALSLSDFFVFINVYCEFSCWHLTTTRRFWNKFEAYLPIVIYILSRFKNVSAFHVINIKYLLLLCIFNLKNFMSMYFIMYSFHKYLLSIYYLPHTLEGPRNT